MCLPATNRSLGEWSKDVADISVELIPLVEKGSRLPSVNEVDKEEEVSLQLALFFRRGKILSCANFTMSMRRYRYKDRSVVLWGEELADCRDSWTKGQWGSRWLTPGSPLLLSRYGSPDNFQDQAPHHYPGSFRCQWKS